MFRRMIHNYLHTRAQADASPTVAIASLHLDEDALAAFVEGRFGERESAPIAAHIVACAACRRISANLIRLQAEVEDQTPAPHAPDEEPNRVRRLLDDLASRLTFTSGEESVFAYHAPADDDAPGDERAKKAESEATQESSDEEIQK